MTLTVSVSEAILVATAHSRQSLVDARFMPRLLAGDSTLWGPAASSEASIRLGWVQSPLRWRYLAKEISQLRESLNARGITRVVLCGMGGSSLGPEVIAASAGLSLTIVDSTHPDHIGAEISRPLHDTVVVVSSKSGGTLETDSQMRAFVGAMEDQNLDPIDHVVVVTDPGSPLQERALSAGFRVFEGDSNIGGRFSALSPFGLVPVGLAGLDIDTFLLESIPAFELCGNEGVDNPALALGTALTYAYPQRNKALLVDDNEHPGFGDWVEQLVAESTGKDNQGILPVAGTSLRSLPDAVSVGPIGSGSDVEMGGSLAELILVWEFATAVVGAQLGVNPFDQPNVESAKVAARELLGGSSSTRRPELKADGFNVWTSPDTLGPLTVNTLHDTLRQCVEPHGYVALCIFAPFSQLPRWREVQRSLEDSLGRPVTLGFGPRFLHSTGQFHKGGPREGVFLQVIQTPTGDVPIPGREFGFHDLLIAQAQGDASVLAGTSQPVISITAPEHSVSRLIDALRT